MLTVVGRVVGGHALKGEFKVQPLTDYPERFYSMKTLSLFRGESFVCKATIINVRVIESKGLFIFKCEEFTDFDSIESISGCVICVPKEERAALRAGEYWIEDLVGMSVIENNTRVLLGKVKDIIRSGENELYIIEGEDGKEHLIPIVDEFIKSIDEHERQIYVALIDGLW